MQHLVVRDTDPFRVEIGLIPVGDEAIFGRPAIGDSRLFSVMGAPAEVRTPARTLVSTLRNTVPSDATVTSPAVSVPEVPI